MAKMNAPKKKLTPVRNIDSGLYREIKILAAIRGVNVGVVINEALTEYIKRHKV